MSLKKQNKPKGQDINQNRKTKERINEENGISKFKIQEEFEALEIFILRCSDIYYIAMPNNEHLKNAMRTTNIIVGIKNNRIVRKNNLQIRHEHMFLLNYEF